MSLETSQSSSNPECCSSPTCDSPVANRDFCGQPDVYFEITDTTYKENPDHCKVRGGLPATRQPHIKKVQRLEASAKGVSFKWYLNRNPYYQLDTSMYNDISSIIQISDIPLETISCDESIVRENDISVF